MVGTVEYRSLHTQNGIAAQDTGLGSLFDTVADRVLALEVRLETLENELNRK